VGHNHHYLFGERGGVSSNDAVPYRRTIVAATVRF